MVPSWGAAVLRPYMNVAVRELRRVVDRAIWKTIAATGWRGYIVRTWGAAGRAPTLAACSLRRRWRGRIRRGPSVCRIRRRSSEALLVQFYLNAEKVGFTGQFTWCQVGAQQCCART